MRPPVIGITLGEAAGIGPEVVKKALSDPALSADFSYQTIGEIPMGTQAGKPTEKTARACLHTLESAVEKLKDGSIQAVVTAPIYKAGLQKIAFPFPGLTEFFAHHFPPKTTEGYTMLFSSKTLTLALATIHIPLAEVPKKLSAEKIIRTGILLSDFLQKKGILKPRIAVAGLNPHAGEEGHLGNEEQEYILPAIKKLQTLLPNTQFTGPYPPDTLFLSASQKNYDAALCMYHDQGLIPLKLLHFDNAVNCTYGLPIIRTSPDHGTAFNIAGTQSANHHSLLQAIHLAGELLKK